MSGGSIRRSTAVPERCGVCCGARRQDASRWRANAEDAGAPGCSCSLSCAGRVGDSAARKRVIVLPLAVDHGAVFGTLQLESVAPFGEGDLLFVDAVVNQLALAVERICAWIWS